MKDSCLAQFGGGVLITCDLSSASLELIFAQILAVFSMPQFIFEHFLPCRLVVQKRLHPAHYLTIKKK